MNFPQISIKIEFLKSPKTWKSSWQAKRQKPHSNGGKHFCVWVHTLACQKAVIRRADRSSAAPQPAGSSACMEAIGRIFLRCTILLKNVSVKCGNFDSALWKGTAPCGWNVCVPPNHFLCWFLCKNYLRSIASPTPIGGEERWLKWGQRW